ncbi:hypothetical protein LCGC14_3043390, partial [marine sediment metagenome]
VEGVNVTVLEKKQMPRVKPCGGALVGAFFDWLPEGIDLTSVIEDQVTTATVGLWGKHSVEIPLEKPIAMVQRYLLDSHLIRQAIRQGATLVQEASVVDLTRGDDRWYVHTAEEVYRAQVVVGADGAYSTIARLSGLGDKRSIFIASEWDVDVPPTVMDQWQGTMAIDFSLEFKGYAWVFPKPRTGILNIGFGSPKRLASHVHERTEIYAKIRGLDGWPATKKAHWVPTALPGATAVNPDGIMLIGDAAGLIDPATEEGLSWAARSSSAAAISIFQTMAEGRPELSFYQESYAQMVQELQDSKALRNVLMSSFLWKRRLNLEILHEVVNIVSGDLPTTYSNWATAHPKQKRIGAAIE